MTASTPHLPEHEALASLASRYVNVAALPWLPTRFKGVELKILMEDQATGLLTALTRFQPGAVLPDHEHVELEQTFVLEGELEDEGWIVVEHPLADELFSPGPDDLWHDVLERQGGQLALVARMPLDPSLN